MTCYVIVRSQRFLCCWHCSIPYSCVEQSCSTVALLYLFQEGPWHYSQTRSLVLVEWNKLKKEEIPASESLTPPTTCQDAFFFLILLAIVDCHRGRGEILLAQKSLYLVLALGNGWNTAVWSGLTLPEARPVVSRLRQSSEACLRNLQSFNENGENLW